MNIKIQDSFQQIKIALEGRIDSGNAAQVEQELLTPTGAAILAGIGTGIYRDVAEGVDACVRMDATYTPNPDSQRVYEEMYPVWRQIYAAQLALCDKGLTKNMWIAPGL